jgi:hypothetical protein
MATNNLRCLCADPGSRWRIFLDRLDTAIGKAWDEEEYIDEING